MARVEARGREIAQEAAERARARIAAQVVEDVRGVSARIEGEAVVLSGRGLWRRWLGDPALRWIGGWWR